MATTRKTRGPAGTRWQGVVRYRGQGLTRTFGSSSACTKWTRDVERAIDAATPDAPFRRQVWLTGDAPMVRPSGPAAVDGALGLDSAVKDVLAKYRTTVTSGKRGAEKEGYRLLAWERHDLGRLRFGGVTADDLQRLVDARLSEGRAGTTVRNDFYCLSAVWTHAALPRRAGGGGGWGWRVSNPVDLVDLPEPGDSRERRLAPGEEDALRGALLAGKDGVEMGALFDLLLSTGMRLGEAMACQASWLHAPSDGARFLSVPSASAKSKKQRRVVLSSRAGKAVSGLLTGRADKTGRLFSVGLSAVSWRWKRAVAAAKVKDIHLHDLRHEALSRMASRGLTIAELQSQSGHATPRILMRYLHAAPDAVAAKLG